MKNSLIDEFEERYQKKPEIFTSAPGRINIIGEHTDYTGGYVLPAAIDRRSYFLAASRNDPSMNLYSVNIDRETSFSQADIFPPEKTEWFDYIKSILWILEVNGYRTHGFDALISGDIPEGAGLSSSAALEISALQGLSMLFHHSIPKLTIAVMAQKAENDFVGIQCGLMDQFISVFGEKHHAIFLDCGTLDHRPVPLHMIRKKTDLFVYDSGIKRNLAASDYNQRRKEASEALFHLQTFGSSSFKDITPEQLDQQQRRMNNTLFKRTRHIVSENNRVLEMLKALEREDLIRVGDILNRSHESLRDDYEVSCPELDLFFEVIKGFPGGLGARLTGAGFGGSGIALVEKGMLQECRETLMEEAKKKGFSTPSIYQIEIDEGIRSHPI